MTIEVAENLDGSQQKMETLSREQLLVELFDVRQAVRENEGKIEGLKAQQKELRGVIDKLNLKEDIITQQLNSAQIVINTCAVMPEEEADSEYPSDDDLSEYDDEPGEMKALPGEIVEPEEGAE